MRVEKSESMAVPLKVWDGDGAVPMEPDAIEQMRRICSLPFIHHHAALMPDAHVGKGATVGAVIPTKGAVIPAAVGVDLGCGMIAARTTLSANHLPDGVAGLRAAIEGAIPHGGPGVVGSWREVNPVSQSTVRSRPSAVTTAWRGLSPGFEQITAKHPRAMGKADVDQLGTLGSGNHFIEICLDEVGDVWLVLHSGSRGPGNRIGSYFIERAKEEARRWHIRLPDPDLAYLPEGSPLFSDYVEAVHWAQTYAAENRRLMLDFAYRALVASGDLPPFGVTGSTVSCHHNYLAHENHFGANVYVTRKGAVSARSGELGIIPGSMGDRTFIVRGKGSRESFTSCSHGAGRVMSRSKARLAFTVEDHAKATQGIECRKDAGVIDETPMAYKPIDVVMAAQTDLVDVVHELRQIVCVKG